MLEECCLILLQAPLGATPSSAWVTLHLDALRATAPGTVSILWEAGIVTSHPTVNKWLSSFIQMVEYLLVSEEEAGGVDSVSGVVSSVSHCLEGEGHCQPVFAESSV